MLLIQLQKVLLSNQYILLGRNRIFGDGSSECFEVLFAGPAGRIPEHYLKLRIATTYPDKNSSQVIELENV